MKNKFNNLLKYIYEYAGEEQCTGTINDLFRSVLEPIAQNKKIEACILLRIFDTKDKETALKRIISSGFRIYNYGTDFLDFYPSSCESEKIWDESEFLIVLSGRYSAALMWDYTASSFKNYAKVCLLYNSSIISEIAGRIADNSTEEVIYELKNCVKKYTPDRRENSLMNKSIQTIASKLNDKNEDYLFLEYSKNNIKEQDETLKTAKIITEKAKFTAHEIKNYLSIINLYSVIAERRLEQAADNEIVLALKNAVKNISSASENISYLINDLRCMSSSSKKQVSLRSIAAEAVDLCRKKIEVSGAAIKEFKADDILVYTDKIKVHCACTNIIFNALDAGAENIWINADKNSIRISNDGEEIPQDAQDKIFEEGYTTKKTGSGLGLAFCREQLRLAGGDIVLLSSDKNKTVFEIQF